MLSLKPVVRKKHQQTLGVVVFLVLTLPHISDFFLLYVFIFQNTPHDGAQDVAKKDKKLIKGGRRCVIFQSVETPS